MRKQTLVICTLLLAVVLGIVGVVSAKDHKVYVCHVPQGNSDNYHIVHVDADGWNGHNHHAGDYLASGPNDPSCAPPPPLVCETGYHVEGDSCVKDPLVCDPGYHVEGDNCVKDPLVCETGYHVEGDSCVKDPLVCDPGYHVEGDNCVKDPLVCETGYHVEGDSCVKDPLVCDPGYHVEGDNCVKDPLVCPTGSHIEGDSCVQDPLVCEPGTHPSDGACVPDEITDQCPNIIDVQATVPDGMHKDDSGNCVPNEPPQCPTGQILVGDVCVPRPPKPQPPVVVPAWQPHAESITAWSVVGNPGDMYWWEYNPNPATQGWSTVLLADKSVAYTPIELRDRWNNAIGAIEYGVRMTRLTIRVNGDTDPTHYRAHYKPSGQLSGKWYEHDDEFGHGVFDFRNYPD